MKILILYEYAEYVQPSIKLIFDKLKYPTDTLHEIIMTEGCGYAPLIASFDVSVCVYSQSRQNAFFNIEVTENMQIDENSIQTTISALESALNDTIYLIFNYTKVRMSDLTGKFDRDEEFVVYIEHKLFMVINTNRFYIRQIHCNKRETIQDNFLICHAENIDLMHKLEKESFYCTDNKNTYTLCHQDECLYLKVNYINAIPDLLNYITGSITKKKIRKQYKTDIHVIDFVNAFCNDELHHDVSREYNKWLKKVQRSKFITVEMLNYLLTKLRKYDDHRKNYYENLLKIYKKRVGDERKTGVKRWAYAVLDSIPYGSLKEFYYLAIDQVKEDK